MPLVSVVMSTYNRADILPESLEAVLNQTMRDFEFIVIDDNSQDSTAEILNKYKDERLKIFHNSQNCGCTFNYHNAHNIAKGKYIAHADDDDISLDTRLEKQIEYMEANPAAALLGAFTETFGENMRPSWVFYTESAKLDFMMNFYNPFCHSSIMYRKSFTDKYAINYDITKRCAQDYDFYKQIILHGGKTANLPEILVKYRMHAKRMTDIYETRQIQIENAEKIKDELLSRYFNSDEIVRIKRLLQGFPFNDYNEDNVIKAVNITGNRAIKKGMISDDELEDIKTDIKNMKF